MTTLLILLFATLAPASVLLAAGFWIVRKLHGDVSRPLGVAAIVLEIRPESRFWLGCYGQPRRHEVGKVPQQIGASQITIRPQVVGEGNCH